MKPVALKFVNFKRIEDHFRQGWVALIPNAPHHHLHYGIELAWLCDCPVPGGFKFDRVNRVPVAPQTESAENERAGT